MKKQIDELQYSYSNHIQCDGSKHVTQRTESLPHNFGMVFVIYIHRKISLLRFLFIKISAHK